MSNTPYIGPGSGAMQPITLPTLKQESREEDLRRFRSLEELARVNWPSEVESDLQFLLGFGALFGEYLLGVAEDLWEAGELIKMGNVSIGQPLLSQAARHLKRLVTDIRRSRPIREVAEIVGYSREHLYDLIRSGRIRARKEAGDLHVSIESVWRYRSATVKPGKRQDGSHNEKEASTPASKMVASPSPDGIRKIRSARALKKETLTKAVI